MHAKASALRRKLQNYKAMDAVEDNSRIKCLELLQNLQDPFNRCAQPAHFTATACIVDETISNILMVKHRSLGLWLFPGGHCDGNQDTVEVARIETFEETGLKKLENIEGILDLSIYPYEREGHMHIDHDVNHLFIGDMREEIKISERELSEVKWVPISEFIPYNDRASHRRIHNKLGQVRRAVGRQPNKELKLNGWT